MHYALGDEQYIERLLSNIDVVLQRAILFDTAVSEANKANKKGSSQFIHYFYSVVEYQGEPFLAKITVEEYLNGNDTTMRTYKLADIEKLSAKGAIGSLMLTSSPNVDSISNISDLFEFVKAYDKVFNPKPSSIVVDKDGWLGEI